MANKDIIKSETRSDFLKLIAIVAMFIDHFGQVFFPYNIYFRIIGRLALPIFAFGIAEGYRHTGDLKKYVIKLLLLGVLSQVPYAYLFETRIWELNILFTLALSVALIYSYERKKYLLAIPVLMAPFFIIMDYGIYGVLLPFLFHLLRGRNVLLILSSAAIFLANVKKMPVSPFHIMAMPLILYWPNRLMAIRFPRYFFYSFYFGHLVFLLLMKIVIFS